MDTIFLLFILFIVATIFLIIRKYPSLVSEIFKSDTGIPKLYRYNRKQYFMTNAESDCYKALVQAVGTQYFIFAQVHLSSIIDEKIKGQNWRASRSRIDRKSVDFVLCDKEYISPKLAIELDDWSHSRQDRQDRDREVERILNGAGVPLLRITNADNLLTKINDMLGIAASN